MRLNNLYIHLFLKYDEHCPHALVLVVQYGLIYMECLGSSIYKHLIYDMARFRISKHSSIQQQNHLIG